MYMNRNEMIDLFKKLMKGEVKTIKCLEPVFDLVERGTRFDFNEDTVIVTLWNSIDNVKESKEMIVDRGLALCLYKQAVWCAQEIIAEDKDGSVTTWEEEELKD